MSDFHDATLSSLSIKGDDLVIELEDFEGRTYRIACLNVFFIGGNGLLNQNVVLDLEFKTIDNDNLKDILDDISLNMGPQMAPNYDRLSEFLDLNRSAKFMCLEPSVGLLLMVICADLKIGT